MKAGITFYKTVKISKTFLRSEGKPNSMSQGCYEGCLAKLAAAAKVISTFQGASQLELKYHNSRLQNPRTLELAEM